jgi:hypothetical protein
VLTNTEVAEALRGDNFKTLKRMIAQDYLGTVKAHFSPEMAQRALDKGGGTNKCWSEMFAVMEQAFGDAGLNIRAAVPNPHQQRECCADMNEAFEQMGATRVLAHDGGEHDGGENGEKIKDNVQLDVCRLLQTLVHLYDIRHDEVGGVLKVCLKMDETIWAGDKKMERLTVTVMNRALAGKERCAPHQWFKVQSETELWPVCMFEVEKESHAVLKRYLTGSALNESIKAHNKGEKLPVQFDDGTCEEFEVEWHAAGDLKTLKCCNGVGTGPTSKCVCLFCMHEREKAKVAAVGNKGVVNGRIWKGGVLNARAPGDFGTAPSRDARDECGNYINDPNWDPVIAIPLSRTHICTMHAENRVVEKLVHLHICKVYNMPSTTASEKESRESRLSAVQQFLGGTMGMRLRGEPFKVEKCPKLSGKYGDTPMKPSFNDVKARSFTLHSSRRVDKIDKVSTSEQPYSFFLSVVLNLKHENMTCTPCAQFATVP